MTKRKNEDPQVKLDKKYRQESSDAAIISSDGITFLVMKYHLMSARYVLS